MRNILGKILFSTIVSLAFAAVFILSCPAYTSDKNDHVDIWYKISTDEANPGELIALDMSRGFAVTRGPHIYLIVKEIGGEDSIVLLFPNGGEWVTAKQDPFLDALQQEFDSLEEYLKNRGGIELKKE